MDPNVTSALIVAATTLLLPVVKRLLDVYLPGPKPETASGPSASERATSTTPQDPAQGQGSGWGPVVPGSRAPGSAEPEPAPAPEPEPEPAPAPAPAWSRTSPSTVQPRSRRRTFRLVVVVWIVLALGIAGAFLYFRPLSSCARVLDEAEAAGRIGWRAPLLGWDDRRGWSRERLEGFLRRCNHIGGASLVREVGEARALLPPPRSGEEWVRENAMIERELDDILRALRAACD